MPGNFTSYEEALQTIKSSGFTYTDALNGTNSSWIKGARYYSCNTGAGGFLILETAKKEYVYQEVPQAVWKEFKNAPSAGKFYNSRIKSNYQLTIKP